MLQEIGWALPQGLKPDRKGSIYRSVKTLRHPKTLRHQERRVTQKRCATKNKTLPRLKLEFFRNL